MRLGSTALYVDDVPVVLDFYRRAFGFTTRFYDPDYQFPELEMGQGSGAALQLASHETATRLIGSGYVRPENGQTTGVEVGFYAPDVAAAFAKAVDAGAKPLREPTLMPWGQTVAYVPQHRGHLRGPLHSVVPGVRMVATAWRPASNVLPPPSSPYLPSPTLP
jgi:lactoylglutathione lyase